MEIFKSDFACLYHRNCRIYAPTDIAIRTDISKLINYRIFSNLVFLWLKNAEFFNYASVFIICIEYQFKSPFFSKIVMAASAGVTIGPGMSNIISYHFFRFWITFVSGKLNFFKLAPKFSFWGPRCTEVLAF